MSLAMKVRAGKPVARAGGGMATCSSPGRRWPA